VSVAVVDSATGKTVKGVRAKPTGKPDDRWVEQACATLLPLLAAAPGSRLPNASGPVLETAPVSVSEPSPTKPQPSTSATSETAGEWRGRGWYENGWAWLGVGAAAAIGAGAGVAGALAWSDNVAANGTAPVDDARNALRSSALQKAVVADVLTGAAVVVGLGAIVAFASGE
jgi:hypothetical protein